MANGNGRQMVRAGRQMVPAPPIGTRSGKWTWDGTQWVCNPGGDCDDFQPPMPCPPVPGFHPWFDPQTNPWYPGANAGVSFGTTAPSFPIRGNFWWDGKRLWMFDGAAWVDIVASAAGVPPGTTPPVTGTGGNTVISTNAARQSVDRHDVVERLAVSRLGRTEWQVVGPGSAVGPVPTTTQKFSISCPTNLALPGSAGSWQIVPFNTNPTIDPDTGYDPVTHKYQPNKPGFYSWNLRGNSGGTAGIALVRNDSGTFTGNSAAEDTSVFVTTGAAGWMMGGGMSLMNGTTDYVRVFARDSTGNFQNTGSNPVFRGYLLP